MTDKTATSTHGKRTTPGRTCQMTVGGWVEACGVSSYGKCGSPAKFRVPNPAMNVEFVCGIHARSLDAMFGRTGQSKRCQPLGRSR